MNPTLHTDLDAGCAAERPGCWLLRTQILNLLRDLQRELGVSYLFITHNIGVVEYIADDVAVMREGRIEEIGAAQSVLEQPQREYTRTLLAAVPRVAAPAT